MAHSQQLFMFKNLLKMQFVNFVKSSTSYKFLKRTIKLRLLNFKQRPVLLLKTRTLELKKDCL